MRMPPPVIMDAQTRVLYELLMDLVEAKRMSRQAMFDERVKTIGDLPEKCDLDALRRQGY